MSIKQRGAEGARVRNTKKSTGHVACVLKRLAVIVLFGLVTIIVGCGTLVERGESSKTYHSSGHYYVGLQYDWRLLVLESASSNDKVPMFCYLSIVCPFATLLSMPVDFVVDTMMLYSDHQNKLIEEQAVNGRLRSMYCLAEDGPDEAALKQLGFDASFCLSVSAL